MSLAIPAAAAPAPAPAKPPPAAAKPAPKPGAPAPAAAKPGAAAPPKGKPKPAAKDTAAPVISCPDLPVSVPAGKVKITFNVTDASPLFGVTFHWRNEGDVPYKNIDFPNAAAKSFTAEFDTQKSFDFFIEAYDEAGNGPALYGEAKFPHTVKVTIPEPVETISAIVPTEPKEEVVQPPEPHAGDASGPMRNIQVSRVFTAKAMPHGMFEIRLAGEFTYGSGFLYPTATVAGQSMRLSAAYQLLDVLAIGLKTSFGRASLSSSAPNTAGSWPLSATTGTDLGLFARVTSGPLGVARLGLLAALEIPAVAPDSASARALGTDLTGLVTIDTPQVRLHANIGYRWDNSENTLSGRWSAFNAFALGVSRYDALHAGAALEIPINKLVPFAEWTIDVPVNRRQFSSCDGGSATQTCPTSSPSLFPAAGWQIPQRVGVGARFEINALMALDLALDVSLTRAGRGYDDSTSGTLRPLEGLPPPAPFAGRLQFAWQFGADAVPEVADLAEPLLVPLPGVDQ